MNTNVRFRGVKRTSRRQTFMSAFDPKRTFTQNARVASGVLLDIHILLARPKTSGCRLPHQVAQFVWTIEEFAAPI